MKLWQTHQYRMLVGLYGKREDWWLVMTAFMAGIEAGRDEAHRNETPGIAIHESIQR